MPKSFLVKKKKPRRAEDGEAVEPVEAVRSEDTNTDEELSLADEMEVETVEILDEEGNDKDHHKESLLSKDIEQEMATSVCKFDGERDSFAVQPVEKRDAKLERSSGCNDICWWSSITSRYELQNLPPPPKLISSVPRNGFSKMHHSHPTEHERSVISLNQRHHFPLTANGFGVMNFHEHRVPSIAESIPVRGSLDGLRELSLNLRHVSEGRRDSPLCPSIPQPSPAPQFNGSHFFIHSHPFLTSHQQQECLTNLQNKEQARKGSESEETKYKCEICNSSFTLQRLLNRHMKTHSFYKRYHCQFCTKGFNDTFDLKRHIRTHTGIKPFKCSRCDKSFTQRCSLEAHLTRVHGVVHKFGFRERRSKLFVCEDCGSTFTENSDFMKHLHEFHPETEKIMRARRNGGFVPKLKGDC